MDPMRQMITNAGLKYYSSSSTRTSRALMITITLASPILTLLAMTKV